MGKRKLTTVCISEKMIQEFFDYLKDKERSEATLRKYAADLKAFYQFLPEGKVLDKDSLHMWKDHLLAKNLAVRTVNTKIGACNSFLGYLKLKDWQVTPMSLDEEGDVPVLTRDEYRELLKAARHADNEWLYFLVKTFCCLGLSVSELPFFTVDALVSGNITIESKNRMRMVFIPEILKIEFLNYAHRANINSGALFKSPVGEVLTRSYIVKELQSLCKEAGIPETKGQPNCLRTLYYTAYSDIRSSSSSLIHREYSKILEEESELVSWENIAI